MAPRTVVTLTPNPSVDRTFELDELRRGEVIRVRGVTLAPSGKGVNVSRALAAHGVSTRAVLPLGGWEGRQLAALAAAEGVALLPVEIEAPVRANVTLVEPDGSTTKLNEPGAPLPPAALDALLARALAEPTGPQGWLCGCGSLPPQAPADLYARLVAGHPHARGVVDATGEALARAVAAGPWLIKPNAHEAAEVLGATLETVDDAVRAAATLRERGARAVLLSLGADGALLVDADGVLHGEARVDLPRDSTGAGDALLAGFLAGGGHGRAGLEEGLRWAWGKMGLTGTRMPTPADLVHASVVVHPGVDGSRRLREPAGPR